MSYNEVVDARQVGRVSSRMPRRVELPALSTDAHVGEIASAGWSRSARDGVLCGEQESGFESRSLSLTAGEDHGQLLTFRPVWRRVIAAAQLVILFLVHERDADILTLQVQA